MLGSIADTKVYFDLDGVLCDWEKQYKKMTDLPLEVFQELPKVAKDAVKQSLFTYEFFRTMEPIAAGFDVFHEVVRSGHPVAICSATGKINVDEVTRGKIDWVREMIGDIEIHLVDKVENKGSCIDKRFQVNVLVDDRERAITAWEAAGGKGMLFK